MESLVRRPKGFVTLTGGYLDDKPISPQAIVDRGLIRPAKTGRGWDLSREEVPVGGNLFVDGGRQMIANLFGGKSPITDYVCSQFSVGTGLLAPRVNDTGLVNPVQFGPLENLGFLKAINSIDYPAPFIARVEFALGPNDANGYLITEMGLFSGNGTLMARLTHPPINKVSSFSPVFLWRIRF